MVNKLAYFLLLSFLFFAACEKEDAPLVEEEPYPLEVPPGFPEPIIPENNQLTFARVELGRQLFYDPVLSIDSTISCASCHHQELAFADNVPISPGVHGRLGLRNSPTLANVAWVSVMNKDGGVPKLDLQPMVPIEDVNEMDLHPLVAADRLNEDPAYREMFMKAYDKLAEPFTITRALGAFMRTFISGNSPYDQYAHQGREDALSEQEIRGMTLFFGDKAKCGNCHKGFNLTDDSFQNNGLYLEYKDTGRRRVTADSADIGFFRVPTLRNIALTAPYMHDGSLASLEEVIDHYNSGGKGHFNQSPLIKALGLSPQEKADLISFLKSLTDTSLINNPALSSPF
jgi:cytochrome c peroxidase